MKRSLLAVVLWLLSLGFFAAHAQENNLKNRLDVFVGAFIPSGEYAEPGYPTFPYDTGMNLGVGYTYQLNEIVGLGAFLEANSFKASKRYLITIQSIDIYGEMDITSLIIGAHLQLRLPVTSTISLGCRRERLRRNSHSSGYRLQVLKHPTSIAHAF